MKFVIGLRFRPVTGTIALGMASALCLAAAPRAEPPATSSWKLTFSDEFDGATLDAAKWSNGYALGATGPGSWPDPSNVSLEGGSLKLYGRKTAGQGKSFAGAAVTTRGKFSQMYGYMEARIKVPNGKGFSGKMTGTKADGGYPPWLDIIETRGEEPNHPYWYLHPPSGEAGGGWAGTNMTTEFHTLGTEWSADELIFTVDGVVKLRDKTVASQLHMAMCWSMELMVGGDSWIGIPDGNTPWPGVYEIDYVRIYQRTGPPTTSLAAQPPRFARDGAMGASGAFAGPAFGYLADGRWWRGLPDRAASPALCGAGCAAPGMRRPESQW